MPRALPSDRRNGRKASIARGCDGKEKDYAKRSARRIFKSRFFKKSRNQREERLSEEEMQLLGKKHGLERMYKDRRHAKMEEWREKLAAEGEVTRIPGSGSQTSEMEAELLSAGVDDRRVTKKQLLKIKDLCAENILSHTQACCLTTHFTAELRLLGSTISTHQERAGHPKGDSGLWAQDSFGHHSIDEQDQDLCDEARGYWEKRSGRFVEVHGFARRTLFDPVHDDQPFCQNLTERRRTIVRFSGQQSEVKIDDTWPQMGEMRSLWKGTTEFWTQDMPLDDTWEPMDITRNHLNRIAGAMHATRFHFVRHVIRRGWHRERETRGFGVVRIIPRVQHQPR